MRARRFLTVSALTLTCLAVTPVVAEAQPVTASTCSATVEGSPGQQVLLDPASMTEPVVRALAPLDPLGLLTSSFRTAWANTGPIPVGTIPNGQSQIGGARIVDAVTAELGRIPLLAPVLQTLASTLRSVLTPLCTLLLHGVLPSPAPPEPAPGSSQPTPVAPGAPGSGESGGVIGNDRAPLPATSSVSPGTGAVFGTRLPDLMPGGALFPFLSSGVPGPNAPAEPSVVVSPKSVGSAEVLPTKQDQLSPAVLAALLLLSVVSAQLVRRWVLGPRH